MKAVIHEVLPRSFTILLKSKGFQVFDVRDHGLRGKDDQEIYRFAQKNKVVLFSADLGFANTLYFAFGTHSGIVILRFPNEMSVRSINEVVKLLLSRLLPKDYPGNLIILSPGKIRISKKQNN